MAFLHILWEGLLDFVNGFVEVYFNENHHKYAFSRQSINGYGLWVCLKPERSRIPNCQFQWEKDEKPLEFGFEVSNFEVEHDSPEEMHGLHCRNCQPW